VSASAEARPGIIDCHTHVGRAGEHVAGPFRDDLRRSWGDLWDVDLDEHLEAMDPGARAVVLAFDAPDIGIVVPNDYVAAYVAQHPDRLIGFASLDPKRPGAPDLLREAVEQLGLRGLKLGPIYQHFHPHDTECFDLLEAADDLGVPVIWHQGTTFVRDAPLDVARPARRDRVATRFPDLPMWIAHLGHPWCEETVVTVRKHPRLFTDISAVHPRPMQFYFALMSAVEYGVADRLLFGSDYPFVTPADAIDGLLSVNDFARDAGLPSIPDEVLRGIFERDSLALLSLD
jgi:uncharacterized protein